jgi:LAO/AO transport system kinase
LTPSSALTQIKNGSRRALAKALSRAQSTRTEHQRFTQALLALIADEKERQAFRIAFSGAPGVGKSTLIEALGVHALQHHRVAVLTFDPSSAFTGGSLLGDKTRMPTLSTHPRAFVRPSPNRARHGGVTSALHDCLRLCEVAGYDPIFVESVGVGQSELDAALYVDCFVLVLTPHAGDEVQALKRGINEAADLVWINQSDTDPAAAQRLAQHYQAALDLLRGENAPLVTCLSALSGPNIQAAWAQLAAWRARPVSAVQAQRKRLQLFSRLAEHTLLCHALSQPRVAEHLQVLEQQLERGALTVDQALRQLNSRLNSESHG